MDEEVNYPTLAEFKEAVDAAIQALPTEGKAIADQGVEHVRELSSKICKNVIYGDENWQEVWTAATLTLYSLLSSIDGLIPGFSSEISKGLALEFMLVGSGSKQVSIEGIDFDTE